jgi:hypothetical protein
MSAFLSTAALLLLAADAALDACEPSVNAASLLSTPVASCAGAFGDEDALLADSGGSCTVEADAVCHMVRRGWFRAAKSALPYVRQAGTAGTLCGAHLSARSRACSSMADESRTRVRKFLEARRDGANSVIALVRRGGDDERTVVTPACQWAQNGSIVALAVRYSPKKCAAPHLTDVPRWAL